jgi:hypothetical protein
MPFFAQPNLDNIQFKQLVGSTLTLSGQTKIATTSGLTLTNGAGGYVPIIATGGTNGEVLTYSNGKIVLLASSSGGSGNYPYTGLTTCTVGGLPSGSNIYNEPIADIIKSMVSPVVCPTVVAPSQTSFSISPAISTYEVGTCISNLCLIASFDSGSVSPVYDGGSSCRSGLPKGYNFVQLGGTPVSISSTLCTYVHGVPPANVQVGNNVVSSTISYSSGSTPVYASDCSVWLSALSSGTTSPACTCTICGMYPYYYGKVASGGCVFGVNRPTPNKYLVTGGTKVVSDSTGTIYINFGSTSDDYVWFATPIETANKTCWYVNTLNNGVIGGSVSVGGNLFPSGATVSDVASTIWANVGCSPHGYKVYVSNYQTTLNTIIELR